MWTEVMNVFLFQDVNKVTHTHASERHNSAVTVLLRATETFLLEGTPLFILLSSAMYQSK